MKTFDWEQLKRTASPERYAFYAANWSKPLTEEEFVQGIKALPRPGAGTPKPEGEGGKRRWQGRSPGRARKDYQWLKQEFGFFTGVIDEFNLNGPVFENGRVQ